MERIFPLNPVLQSMAFRSTGGDLGELKIVLIKRQKGSSRTLLEAREYANVPQTVVYTWFYKNTASEVLKYYAAHIRKKFTLLKIVTL